MEEAWDYRPGPPGSASPECARGPGSRAAPCGSIPVRGKASGFVPRSRSGKLDMLRKIRILLADDHPVVRQGFKLIINQEPDMEVVGEASEGAETVRLTQQL